MPTPPNNKGRKVKKINHFTTAHLLTLLFDGLLPLEALAAETGLHYVTVCDFTRELHRARVLYIDHFDEDTRGRLTLTVYKIGRQPDAKRTPLTEAEKQKRYREGKKLREQQAALSIQPCV